MWGPRSSQPGWRDDRSRPGIQRYWTGEEWDETIPPRAKPEPAWKGVRVIALGILIAVAVIWFVWQANQPSEFDCLEQATDVVLGDRAAVESACRR